MKILIIDRDALSCQLLQSRLGALGQDVTCEPVKNDALALLENEDFDAILFDPSPVQDARAIIISIYKVLRGRPEPQFILLSKTMTHEDALAAGANDLIVKPINPQALEGKIENLERLLSYSRLMAREEEFAPIRGIIGKDAFNELFLSAIDRAHRYAERSFVVFITVKTDEKSFESLSRNLRHIRRQSDVIGRVDACEFGILLQRPVYESEPFDATTRFTEVISRHVSELEAKPAIEVNLRLVEIPLGECHIHTRVTQDETTVVSFREQS